MLNKVARFLPLLYLFSVLQVVLHAEDQFFNSAGVRIHYTIDGKGEPVILTHGYALSITTNRGKPGIIKGLSDSYEVIAIDSEKSSDIGEGGPAGLDLAELDGGIEEVREIR
jgi:hypothetical protein